MPLANCVTLGKSVNLCASVSIPVKWVLLVPSHMVLVKSECVEQVSSGIVPTSLSILLAGYRYAFWGTEGALTLTLPQPISIGPWGLLLGLFFKTSPSPTPPPPLRVFLSWLPLSGYYLFPQH